MLHLVRRFVRSLWPAEPSADDVRWAHNLLSPAEQRLWDAQTRPDRSHTLRVARRVDDALADRPGSDVGQRTATTALVAALLHDVGKSEAALGTFGRVVAAVLAPLIDDDTATRWAAADGWRRRIGNHLTYIDHSVALLTEAGSAPLVVAWAAEHHDPPDSWTVDARLGRVLAAADE